MVVDRLGTTFAALSDPTRRAMIERLSHGPASVHGLTEPFALSQQMISKHIAYLVRARIVIKTKRGRESVCTLRPEAIKTVSDWAVSYRRFWEESFDKLEIVVNQMKKEEARDGRKRWIVKIERMVVTRVFDAPHPSWFGRRGQTRRGTLGVRWWGPKGFTAPVCQMDVRVGGKSLLCMTPDGARAGMRLNTTRLFCTRRSFPPFSDSKGNKIDPAQLGIEPEAIDGAYDADPF